MSYYADPGDAAAAEAFASLELVESIVYRDRLRCPFCGTIHHGLCQEAKDAPLTRENMLRIGRILTADPADRPALTPGGSDANSETPGPT